jgi:uncharacterized protein YgiM (DUF1202 family)
MNSEPFRHGFIIKPYLQPYPDPIRVRAGERIIPDLTKQTNIPGWVWCSDERGKSGWVPKSWMRKQAGRWIISRDFDAIELTVKVGEPVTIHAAESGFVWVTTTEGRSGWIPEDCVYIEKS